MRKIGKGLGVLGAAASLTLAGMASAGAINRVACTDSGFLQISSSQSTCWANAGTVDVKLYGVYGFSAGQNAGTIVSENRRQVFSKNSVGNWDKNDPVIRLAIN